MVTKCATAIAFDICSEGILEEKRRLGRCPQIITAPSLPSQCDKVRGEQRGCRGLQRKSQSIWPELAEPSSRQQGRLHVRRRLRAKGPWRRWGYASCKAGRQPRGWRAIPNNTPNMVCQHQQHKAPLLRQASTHLKAHEVEHRGRHVGQARIRQVVPQLDVSRQPRAADEERHCGRGAAGSGGVGSTCGGQNGRPAGLRRL